MSHLTVNAMSSSRSHSEPAGMSADGSADHFLSRSCEEASASSAFTWLSAERASSSRSAVDPGSSRVLCGALDARNAAACRGDDEVSASDVLLTWQLFSAESVAFRLSPLQTCGSALSATKGRA